jgi:CheY-like chemotaxis protein
LFLGEALKEAVKLLRSTLPSTIELSMDIRAETRPVMVDPVQVEQILMNLCINARDAMNGSGPIDVSLSAATCDNAVCASCHQSFSGQFVVIAVHDHGPGVPIECHDRIFEPFFTTKDTGKGSGMGLATVHGIVHENGGHIIVHTTPARGAEFQALFKPVPATQTKSQPSRSTPETTNSKLPVLRGRVLGVDDDEAAGEFMQDLLTHWGLEVRLIRGAIEAREVFTLDSQSFDLAVLDQTMPHMTGIDLARHLLAIRPDLPIILYTGFSESLDDDVIRSSGVRALIRKPVNVEKLRSLINDLSSVNVSH